MIKKIGTTSQNSANKAYIGFEFIVVKTNSDKAERNELVSLCF